jgi:hypothetical protein
MDGIPRLLSHPAGAPWRREERRSVAAPSASRGSQALLIGGIAQMLREDYRIRATARLEARFDGFTARAAT